VKTSGWCSVIILFLSLAGGALAQGRGFINAAPAFNPAPVFQGSFGNVVFPGGTAADPGVVRFFPNAAFPAGNAPKIYTPFTVTDPTRIGARFGQGNRGFGGGFGPGGFGNGSRRTGTGVVAVPYYVPIYVGGYAGYSGYSDAPPPDAGLGGPAPGGTPQNVIVVYPPATAPPVFGGAYGETALGPAPPPPPQAPAPASTTDQQGSPFVPASYYMIAYKDHTIYSAVAYWVEGDTLHYFTTGATHNQVSLALVDRDLTQRLNEELGNNLQLPNK
jgi:hypothetical protein